MKAVQKQTLNSLCTAIKVYVQKGDSSTDKAEKFYGEAGRRLAALKQRLRDERPADSWAAYVEARCSLKQSRADELIRIGTGKTTVAESREKNAASKRNARANKSAGHPADSNGKTTTTQQRGPGRPEAFPPHEPGKGCDWDPTNPKHADIGEPYHQVRARGYFASVAEAIRQARENLMVAENNATWARLDPSEITDEVIQAAEQVLEAWSECIEKLRRMRGEVGNGKEEKPNRQALH